MTLAEEPGMRRLVACRSGLAKLYERMKELG
jgi:hypothetical protein